VGRWKHLLFNCNFFGSVWNHILRWLGISAVMPCHGARHFIQFSVIGGAAKSKRSVLQVIWFTTMWEIWKEINNRVFNDKNSPIPQMADRIKSLTFTWLKEKYTSLPPQLSWLVV